MKDHKKLFLIDAAGALLSAFMLGIILPMFEHIFGIPIPALYFLALLPCFFALYDFYWYRSKGEKLNSGLKRIAYMNLAYVVLSLGLAFYHIEYVTIYGWAYIVLEVLIIIVIAGIELKAAKAEN